LDDHIRIPLDETIAVEIAINVFSRSLGRGCGPDDGHTVAFDAEVITTVTSGP
ncbi:MAG: hypothetical protein QOJ40_1534, partial [Verrucomicrobiota bacterium]